MKNKLVLVDLNPTMQKELDLLNESAEQNNVLVYGAGRCHALVTNEYPEIEGGLYQVTLCTSHVEQDHSATEYDRLIPAEVSGLTYSLMAHTDIITYVVPEQIVKVLSDIPTSIYDPSKGVCGEWGGEPLGTKIAGVLDRRWHEKSYWGQMFSLYGAEGTARLLISL